MNAKQYQSTIAQMQKSSIVQIKHSEEDYKGHWNDLKEKTNSFAESRLDLKSVYVLWLST